MIKEKIGKNILKIREEKNVSRADLAEKAKISYNYLSQIEQERKRPTIPVLEKISTALDVPLASLFGEDGFTYWKLQEIITDIGNKYEISSLKTLLSQVVDILNQSTKSINKDE